MLGQPPRGRCDDEQRWPTLYTRCSTADRDEAEQVVSELYLPNRLDLLDGEEPLGMEVAGLRLGALTAGRLTYGRRVRVQTTEASNYHVNIPLQGRATSRRGTGEARDDGPRRGPRVLTRRARPDLLVGRL